MAQWVKDLMSLLWLWSLLWHGFNPWPENFHVPWVWPKNPHNKKLIRLVNIQIDYSK